MTQSILQHMHPDDLVPYYNNPRHNQDAVGPVAESIKAFGFKVPIVVDENLEVITGHTRLKAAKQLGLDRVPVIVAGDLDEDQVRAYRLADNKVAELASWDDEKLLDELAEISSLDMALFGFDDAEALLDELTEDENEGEIEEDDYDDELKETDIKPGDIFQLGRHRLSCGDSTDPQHIKKLLDGALVDTVYTDPPYGMKKEKDGVQNDNLNYDDLLEFNKKWVPITFDAMKEVGSWYCWGIDEPLMDLYSNILRPMKKQNKITFRNLLTWDKGSGQGQLASHMRMYPTADEKCLFVMKGVQGFNINTEHYHEGYEQIRTALADVAQRVGLTPKKTKELTGSGMYQHWFTKSQWYFITRENFDKIAEHYGDAWDLDYDELKEQYERAKREEKETWTYFDVTHDNFNNVLHFDRTVGEEREQAGGHATPKPLALVSLMLKSSTRPFDLVLDVFGGSGSTLIACEQLGRTCYMNELDPQYVDVIIRRWENLTGEKAVKLHG